LKVDGIRCAVEYHVVVHVSWTTAPATVKICEPDVVVARINNHMKQKFRFIGVCVHPHVFAGVADVETKLLCSEIKQIAVLFCVVRVSRFHTPYSILITLNFTDVKSK